MIISFDILIYIFFGIPVIVCAGCAVVDTYFQFMYFKWNKEERKKKLDQVKD